MKTFLTIVLTLFFTGIVGIFILYSLSYRVEDYYASGPNYIPDRNDKTMHYYKDGYFQLCNKLFINNVCDGDSGAWGQFMFFYQKNLTRQEFMKGCPGMNPYYDQKGLEYNKYKLKVYCDNN